jgi:starch phosphorylase
MLHAGQARIRSFRVVPDLPQPLKPLLELAHNLWWSWHPEAVDLFKRLDRELWQETYHNPVKMLGLIRQSVLDRAAEDQAYLHSLNTIYARFKSHRERLSWFQRQYAAMSDASAVAADAGIANPSSLPLRVAYFCAEFGLTECFQIYSGGLGCLAGDHLKSASELGIPLCAVGLLYRCGYFHQYLNADGWQQETYPDQDFPNQPIHRMIDPETGEQYRVSVELPGRQVTIGVWRCSVGRIPLYLLDTNFPENRREDRDITRTLYGGDIETRIQQEIVLGIGGVRALAKIGEKPTVFHMNEGHAAFAALERVSMLRERWGCTFDEANRSAASANIFTTHTPVPAGIDRFSPELLARYFDHYVHKLGLDMEGLLALGRGNVFDKNEFFSMAVLAIRTSNYANGVSRLHGVVSRKMWANIWPGVPEPEVPISSVTNGVHARSWVSPSVMRLFERYLGQDWQSDPNDYELWDGVSEIPDEELWRAHGRQREKLITWARKRIRRQLRARGLGHDEIEKAAAALSPDIFTIGFARRFATYKRGTLLMHDKERLKAILTNKDRPVQLLVAGKAHPADGPGKELIREIVRFATEHEALRRVVFLEDYDIEVARRLVQGCDVWLNTPRRGMEASGTSGMKAAMNGVINISILDGWFDEGYEASSGFAIGKGESYDDTETQDQIESRALYELLERQILPEFYQRDESGLPRKWLARMKSSIRLNTPRYSTNRMVADYTEEFYLQAHGVQRSLTAGGLEQGKGLAHQVDRLRRFWEHVGVRRVESNVTTAVPVRTPIRVRALVELGSLRPDEVRVQLYHGEVSSLGDMVGGSTIDMVADAGTGQREGVHAFSCEFAAGGSGRRGFTVRVVPRDERLVGAVVPGLISWYGTDDANFHFAPGDTARFTAPARPGEPVAVH